MSLTTVLAGSDLGRRVWAVPDPVTSVASSGPNELIRQGYASVVTQASDVFYIDDNGERCVTYQQPYDTLCVPASMPTP